MELRDLDFSKSRFNPNAKTFVSNISNAIPEFKEFKHDSRRNIFQYVVAMYDKGSPLWVKEPEYFPRKVMAANLTKLSGPSFNSKTMEILEGRNDDVNKLITAYLADSGDIEYTMLITELTMYHGLFHQQAGGVLLDASQYKTMKELMENIQSRTRRIFGSGEDEELRRVKTLLYEKAEQDRQRMNPEAIVKMIEKDGDFPTDWGRYGRYKVEPLTYYQEDDS